MIMEKFSVVGANKTASGGIFTRSSEPLFPLITIFCPINVIIVTSRIVAKKKMKLHN